jgi:hypothetical protein
LAKPIDPQSPEIQALRERFFQGRVKSPTLCAIVDRVPRTLARWKARGLPYTTIGNEDWFDLDQVRHWLEIPKSRAGAPRPRGRPKSPHNAEAHRRIAHNPPAAKRTPERYRQHPDPPVLAMAERGAREAERAGQLRKRRGGRSPDIGEPEAI